MGLVDIPAARVAVAGRHRSTAAQGRVARSIPPGLPTVAILRGLAALPLSLPLPWLPALSLLSLSLLSLPRLLSSLLRLARLLSGLLTVTGLLPISVLIPALQRIGLAALAFTRLVALALLGFGQLLHAAPHSFRASQSFFKIAIVAARSLPRLARLLLISGLRLRQLIPQIVQPEIDVVLTQPRL